MTGLVLKLAPKERILINGAVIENGEKKTRISIKTQNANILRLRDAIHPEDAVTPLSRVCYICQLLLTGDADMDQAKSEIINGIEQLSFVMQDEFSKNAFDAAMHEVFEGNFYQVLKQLRAILPHEARLLLIAES